MRPMSFERHIELETALSDAKHTADVVAEWMGQAVGFDDAKPPMLTEATCSNIIWAANAVARLIGEADRIFHKPEMKEGR